MGVLTRKESITKANGAQFANFGTDEIGLRGSGSINLRKPGDALSRGQVRRIADVRRDEHIVRKVPTTDPTHSAVTDLHEIVHLARRNFVQGRRGTASDSVP